LQDNYTVRTALLVAIAAPACAGAVRPATIPGAPPAPLQSPATPALWGELRPGPFDVGFTIVALVDRNRAYGAQAARPVQLSLWFPVERAAGHATMPFRDYVVSYAPPGASDVVARYRDAWFPHDPPDSVDRLLATATFAVRDAPPARGRFPLVVYAPGYGGSPLTHTPGAEYLASHGYIVAMSPSQGDSPAGITFDEGGQEQQVRDLELTIAALRDRPGVDASKIALVGFSFGGGAALIEAMRAPAISAVVVLDGTPVFEDASDIVRRATGFDAAAVRAPVLVLTSDHLRDEDLTIVQSMVLCDRRLIRFKAVDHHDFIASPIIAGVVRGGVSPSARRAFPIVTRAMLGFIATSLGQPGAPSEGLPSPTDTAAPGEPVSELALPRLDAPSRDQLLSMVIERADVTGLAAIQRAFSKRGGVPLLTAGSLYMLGLKLLDRGLTDQAIELFELLVELYPTHVRTLNLLGDLYSRRGDRARAEQRYRASLTVKPGNGGAMSGMEVLGTSSR
jgi:pimeloyl-ACP methyl ester carboxylesterase